MLGIDSRWTQNGALSIRSVNATGNAPPVFSSSTRVGTPHRTPHTAHAHAHYDKRVEPKFLHPTAGVQVLGGGLWRQDGPAQINVTSELGGRGVHLAGGSVWLQGASVSINVVADRSNCVGTLMAAYQKRA
jgi:hypothetical protein